MHAIYTVRPLAIALAFMTPSASAAPALAGIVAGTVQLSHPAPDTLLVTQSSAKAIVEWHNFSIAAGETVRFQQPDAGSIALNRVTGNDPSVIQGRLSANGKVFLVNRNGILFGAGSRVDVGSMVASTMDIGNDDFLAGRYRFSASGSAAVQVERPIEPAMREQITAAERGTIALLGATVSNQGSIVARLGTVGLAAGASVTLDFAGDGLTQISVTPATIRSLVENGGAIVADGGQIVLRAGALSQLASALVKQGGTLQANSLVERNGKLVLDAGPDGSVNVSGALAASALEPGLRGGAVTLLGQDVTLAGGASVDVRGSSAGGSVLVDGAARIALDSGATLRADAIDHGDGGTVTLRSTGAAALHGLVSAHGGAAGGNGGVVRTGAAQFDAAGFQATAAAPAGAGGSWVLDAGRVYIGPALAASIGRSLDANTQVLVNARAQGGDGFADIIVAAPILKTGAGRTQLALHAGQDIVLMPQGAIAASGQASLDVDLHGAAFGGAGAIFMDAGSAIRTNGGALAFDGSGSNDYTNGVALSGATLDSRVGQADGAGGGAISIRGRGGVGVNPGTDSAAGAPAWSGVVLARGSSILGGASLNIAGSAADRGGAGADLSGQLRAGGDVTITGLASGSGGAGVVLHQAAVATTAGGAIRVAGRGAGASGLELNEVALTTAGGPGQIVLAGEAAGAAAGLRISGLAIGGAGMRGDVAISALNRQDGSGEASQMMAVDPDRATTIRTDGVVNLRPGGVDASGGLTEAVDVAIGVGLAAPFRVALDAFGIGGADAGAAGRMLIGSSAHRGAIRYGDSSIFNGDLSLQNGGAGSAGIVFAAPLTVSGLLTLSSGGLVSSSDQPLRAAGLLLHGTQPGANFVLNNGANRFGALAARFDGEVQADQANGKSGTIDVYSSTALALTGLQGDGYGAAGVEKIAAARSSVAGDVLVRSAATLTLAQDLRSNAGAIMLVAGTQFDNRAHATLAPASGAGWKVFADTWIGEERGGLLPSQPRPNYYGCAWGAACAASLAALAGNHYIYRQQPTLVLTGATLARLYGDANPVFAYAIGGLVNGDGAADVLAGSYSSGAGAASNVGSYALKGSFSSPVGYAIDARAGSLTIHPAPLLISIGDAAKVYGGADPQLAASYSGFKLDDTSAVVSGLALAAPRGADAGAGTHAITGSGASAPNYSIAYRDGTLTVARAQLLYTANPAQQVAGQNGAALGGSVGGFVYGDALATATTGTLVFDTPAARPLAVGSHAVLGSGLRAANYTFAQAPANARALTVLANPQQAADPRLALLASLPVVPDIARDLTFSSSALYDKNVGANQVCVGAATFASNSGAGGIGDALGVEWSRVRTSPNLSNCFSLGERHGCQDF